MHWGGPWQDELGCVHKRKIFFIPTHDDIIRWKHFPCYWHFMRGIHQSLVDSPHKGQWRGTLKIPLFCTSTKGWANNQDTGVLRHYSPHYDVNELCPFFTFCVCILVLSAIRQSLILWHHWPNFVTSFGVTWGHWVNQISCKATPHDTS